MEKEVKRWITVNGKHIPIYDDSADKLSFLDNNPKLEKWVEKAFDKANLMGEDADIYEALYSYKAIRELDEEQIEALYDYLADRLGFR